MGQLGLRTIQIFFHSRSIPAPRLIRHNRIELLKQDEQRADTHSSAATASKTVSRNYTASVGNPHIRFSVRTRAFACKLPALANEDTRIVTPDIVTQHYPAAWR
jgi:hypothetical protein